MITGLPSPLMFGNDKPPEVIEVAWLASGSPVAGPWNLGNINVSDPQNRPRIVVVASTINASNGTISATLGGSSMTVASNQATTNLTRAILYRRINPTDTSLNLTLSASGGNGYYAHVFMVYTSDDTSPTVITANSVTATTDLLRSTSFITMCSVYANTTNGTWQADPEANNSRVGGGTWAHHSSSSRVFKNYSSAVIGRTGMSPVTQPRTQICIFK